MATLIGADAIILAASFELLRSDGTHMLKIDSFIDVACPWCFIATRRLELALLEVPHSGDVSLEYHGVFTHPEIPLEGTNLREFMHRALGRDGADDVYLRVELEARITGLTFDYGSLVPLPSSVRAHTLVRCAARTGSAKTLVNALYEAYFEEQRDIGRVDVLVDVATRNHFSSEDARRLLEDASELERTRTEAQAAVSAGVLGIPYFTVGSNLSITGCQDISDFRRALAQALEQGEVPSGRRAAGPG